MQHKYETEVELLKSQNKHDLETIQEKVAAAMTKKKEVIEQLQEELRLRDLQISKLREVMDKQRNQMLDQ